MADSAYTADLFESPADAAPPALASDNSHSRNFNRALPSPAEPSPQPLLPLDCGNRVDNEKPARACPRAGC
jgi:hypothetical protein